MDFLSKLKKDAAKLVVGARESWIAKTASAALNYLFGKVMGMLAGYTMLLYGPPKSGKSLLAFAYAGQLHKDDPEAIVLHFDTEFRDNVDTWVESFGIDKSRFISRQTNNPVEIFDYIANDLKAMLQEGAPIKMIIVDSLAMINYPKEANRDKTTDFVIGDAAAYLGPAMKLILPVIRTYKIALILCQHVRDNMDPNTAKYRPYVIPGGKALKHSVEYWVLCEKVNAKDAKTFDSDKKDGAGNPIQTGHTIRVRMEENSLGPQNRAVEIDLSYTRGIINHGRGIAEIAVNMGIVERPNQAWYAFDGKKWQGAAAFQDAVEQDTDLQHKLVNAIRDNDLT